MNNKYVRKHLRILPPVPEFCIGNIEDRSIARLHLNINNFSDSYHRCYIGEQSLKKLAQDYLHIFPQISNLDSDQDLFSENQFLFTQGSAEAIDLLIRAYCEPKEDSVITTPPTFPYYGYRAFLENVKNIEIPLQGDVYSRINVDAIVSTPSKLLFLCVPNNPVGTLLSREQIERVLQSFSGLVVIDEAYLEWSNEPSFVSLLSSYPNLIILRTFSKFWGLAGVRCGVMIAHESILAPLRSLQTILNFPTPSQRILEKAISQYARLAKYKKRVIEMRSELSTWLQSYPFTRKVFPSFANFLLVECVHAQELTKYLQERNIFIKDVSNLVPNSVRISIGRNYELKVLKKNLINFYKEKSLCIK